MAELSNRIKELVVGYTKTPLTGILSSKRLDEDLGIDSLYKMSLILDIEKEFALEITNREISDLKTVGDLILLVGQKITHATGR